MCRHLSLNTKTSALLQDKLFFCYYSQVVNDHFAALKMSIDMLFYLKFEFDKTKGDTLIVYVAVRSGVDVKFEEQARLFNTVVACGTLSFYQIGPNP